MPTENFSDSEVEFLQPISKFSPPNEIITKNYSPDEKPYLKLAIIQKVQQSTCQQLRNQYQTIFDGHDTLGYHYSYSLSNDLVYIKFNNQNYFKYKNKSEVYKLLSAVFIPVEKLLSNEVKISKNIYKTLPDIQFVEYRNKIQESFDKNNKTVSQNTVKFSSNYDSANLFIAMKKRQNQYDLVLQSDINSKGSTQWFNFAVQLSQQGTYKFNILNFTKPHSQYQDGMKIVYYSYREQQTRKGWTRGCDNIVYQQSSLKRQDSDYRKYSCLKFQYTSNFASDTVVFAYFYPYTGLDLEKFMKRVVYKKISVYMRMQTFKICETVSGLPVYAIYIKHKRAQKQQPLGSPKSSTNITIKPNKTVAIMARQHSGQTQGSFAVEGIVEMLMENNQIDLKKNIDFIIFPMVNPDGVLYGNYRTNLSGADLNRVWRNPRKQLQPQVYFIKKFLQNANKNAPISLVIDLHGHSKSYNSFFYGNPIKKDATNGSFEDPRIFPYVCSKRIKQISFSQSTFSISEDKKNSARVVLSEMFPKAHVYTLEHSFHGWKRQQGCIVHDYTPDSLKKIGRELMAAYLQFDKLCEKNPQIKQKWVKQINDLSKTREANGSQDQGSDSEAQLQLVDINNDTQMSLREQNNGEKSIFNTIQDVKPKRYRSKENFIHINTMIKSHSNDRIFRKYHQQKVVVDNSLSEKFVQQKHIKLESAVSKSGFLSIIKIRTPSDNQTFQIKGANSALSEERKDDASNKNVLIEKLKKKKIKIQQAISMCSGIKTFLKAMGIPLEKKY